MIAPDTDRVLLSLSLSLHLSPSVCRMEFSECVCVCARAPNRRRGKKMSQKFVIVTQGNYFNLNLYSALCEWRRAKMKQKRNWEGGWMDDGNTQTTYSFFAFVQLIVCTLFTVEWLRLCLCSEFIAIYHRLLCALMRSSIFLPPLSRFKQCSRSYRRVKRWGSGCAAAARQHWSTERKGFRLLRSNLFFAFFLRFCLFGTKFVFFWCFSIFVGWFYGWLCRFF